MSDGDAATRACARRRPMRVFATPAANPVPPSMATRRSGRRPIHMASDPPGRLQLRGEELERLARLGVLLAREVDAAAREHRPALGGDLESLVRRALGR